MFSSSVDAEDDSIIIFSRKESVHGSRGLRYWNRDIFGRFKVVCDGFSLSRF